MLCLASPLSSPVVDPSPSLADLRNKVTFDEHLKNRHDVIHLRGRKSRARILCAIDHRSPERFPGETWQDTDRLSKRKSRLYACCLAPCLHLDDERRLIVEWGMCRDRLCPTCQAQRARHVALRASAIIGSYNAPRFLTLTIAADGGALSSRLDHLMTSYRKLRRSRAWQAHFSGGVATVEVKRNLDSGNWHVHLHAIVEGEFWAQREISDAWRDATGDSFIVDIRAVHDRDECAKYIAKYISKAADLYAWPDAAIREFAIAMAGRRLLMTFGQSHGRVLDEAPKSETRYARKFLCHVDPIIERAISGDELAIGAMLASRLLGPKYTTVFGINPACDFNPNTTPADGDLERLISCLEAAVGIYTTDAPFLPP